ncbi:5540_t:CDS:2 [Cetraspora pellucida]|uniref:5540_t:CDS:1 n=1 Tax=Cetraspora pellucida TaxID=1433469 RepID=A0A9N8WBH3_9GLOM|nr:5540_t:CDS:2 [Cetraspora pellucida]
MFSTLEFALFNSKIQKIYLKDDEEKKKTEIGTRSTCTKKHKLPENKQELPPPSSDFKPFIYQKPLHRVSV